MKKATLIFIILNTIVISSCNKYQKLLKSSDNEAKFTSAMSYYNTRQYNKSLQLFEQISPFYRGTEKAEQITYYTAYSYYNQKDYMLASYFFKTFSRNYPSNDKAEECAFLSAYCKFLESPKYSLDQSSTKEAMTELQLFINQYPNSNKVEESNKLLDELRFRLEKKYFDIANLYYKMYDYKAAIVNYKNLLKDYPDTKFREDIMLLTAKSYFEYAENSIKSKKNERYQQAIDAIDNMIANYPNTKYLKEIKKIKIEAQNKII